jgi:cephalosporin-C deacetylase-like acetyl esterase
VEILDERALWATREGQVSLAFAAANRTVFDLNQDRLRALRSAAPAQADAVRRMIGFAPPATAPREQSYGAIAREGYTIHKLVYDTEPGITVPGLLYVPANAAGKLAATILVFGAGKAAAHSEAEKIARSGAIAFAIDPRGLGETRAIPEKYGSDWPRYFGDYESAMTAMLTGKPLVAMRAEDIVAAVNLLAARPIVDASRIAGHGREMGAIPLLYAAAFDSRITAVRLERSIQAYEAIVRHRIHRQQWENAVVGALRLYDLPDLERFMTPRKVTWIEPLYPNGQLMPLSR